MVSLRRGWKMTETQDNSAKPQAQPGATQAQAAENPPAAQVVSEEPLAESLAPLGPKRKVSALRVILLVNGAALLGLVVMMLAWPAGPTKTQAEQKPAVIAMPQPQPHVAAAPTTDPQIPVAHAPPAQSASWVAANKLFREKNYAAALAQFLVLEERLADSAGRGGLRDLCRLRQAQCRLLGRQADAGRQMLIDLCQSPSPIIRVIAGHELAVMDHADRRFSVARGRSSQVLALLGVLEKDFGLEASCEAISAQALSSMALALGNGNQVKWRPVIEPDPFAALDVEAAAALVAQGADELAAASLGPQARPAESGWQFAADRAPLEEALGRLATAADLKVQWQNVEPSVRQRPVSIACKDLAAARIAELLLGQVALVGTLQDKQLTVIDPAAMGEISAERDLFASAASAAWQRFFLRYGNDKNVPLGHLALGYLHESVGKTTEALAEYDLIARSFSADPAGAAGRLRTAQLRMTLRDYSGARAEILELLNRYPDCPEVEEVYLVLGQSTIQAKLYEEAEKAFTKLYNLKLSSASQLDAALGAGKALHLQGKHKEALRWLEKYAAAQTDKGPALAECYLLAARSYAQVGQAGEAGRSYCRAILSRPEKQQLFEASTELARLYQADGRFSQALATLGNLENQELSDQQGMEITLLKSSILRSMGLAESASKLLLRAVGATQDQNIRGQLSLELSRCFREMKDSANAIKAMSEAAAYLRGPQASQASIEMARLCLDAGLTDRAIEVAGGVMESGQTDELKREAAKVLAAAYVAQKDYKKAATVLASVKAEDKP